MEEQFPPLAVLELVERSGRNRSACGLPAAPAAAQAGHARADRDEYLRGRRDGVPKMGVEPICLRSVGCRCSHLSIHHVTRSYRSNAGVRGQSVRRLKQQSEAV